MIVKPHCVTKSPNTSVCYVTPFFMLPTCTGLTLWIMLSHIWGKRKKVEKKVEKKNEKKKLGKKLGKKN